jgi:hypothetical protein
MKAEGLPASLIAKTTGLPEEEIDKNVHGNYIQSLI